MSHTTVRKDYEPQQVLNMMHNICVVILGNGAKYWPKVILGTYMEEAIKFAVTSLAVKL